MSRLTHVWRGLDTEQRAAAIAAVALLVTMFLPWYGLQSVNRGTKAIYSHDINAFGDVSFIEAAIFLVAAGVLGMLFARGEGRRFQLPGGDGTIVMIAGLWAALLIFYRVFSRPAGGGYPVGIEWGFFLAFVAAGALAYTGLRMRALERPQPPLTRRDERRHRGGGDPAPPPSRSRAVPEEEADTVVVQRRARSRSAPVPARAAEGARAPDAPALREGARAGERSPYPPAPPARPRATGEQLSFEDPPRHPD